MLDEPGTDDARTLYSTTTAAHSSRLLVPETHSAVARATAGQPFTAAGRMRAFELLCGLLDNVQPLELDESVAERAAEVATTLGLRASDAVHFASFERIEAGDAVLVAADGDLVRAAALSGYAVAVPGQN